MTRSLYQLRTSLTRISITGGRGAYATAYGLFNTAFAGGMLIGPIWGGFVSLRAGWGTMCWSLAVLSLVGGMVSGLFTGGWVGGKGEKEGDGGV